MGFQGMLRSALILEGSVPSAVNASLLAFEFNAVPIRPRWTCLYSTVLSAGTLWLTSMGISAWA